MVRRLMAVAALTLIAGCGSSDGEATKATDPVPAKVTAPAVTTTAGDEVEATTTTAAPTKGSSKTDPLPIGEAAKIAEFNVKVTDVNADATTQVLEFNQFNDPPSNGRYVLLSYEATYTGTTEGTPSSDLGFTLSGGDAKQYDRYDCGASLSDDSYGTTVEAGGTTTGMVCFDVPPEAIDGGAVFIEDNMSFDNESRVFWALG